MRVRMQHAQPFTTPAFSPMDLCLELPAGHLLLTSNSGDALTVALPPLSPQEASRVAAPPAALPAVNPCALHCSAPISDIAIADLQGLGQNQVHHAGHCHHHCKQCAGTAK